MLCNFIQSRACRSSSPMADQAFAGYYRSHAARPVITTVGGVPIVSERRRSVSLTANDMFSSHNATLGASIRPPEHSSALITHREPAVSEEGLVWALINPLLLIILITSNREAPKPEIIPPALRRASKRTEPS